MHILQIERIDAQAPGVRIYRLTGPKAPTWIAWYDSGKVELPEDAVSAVKVTIDTGLPKVTEEPLITEFGRTAPAAKVVTTTSGAVEIDLTFVPVFIHEAP